MKRILYVLALLSATVLVSCEKSSGGGGGGGGASGDGGGGSVTVEGSEPFTDKTPLWITKDDNEQFGYMDAKGNIVISYAYSTAKNFSSGLATVKKNGLWYVIDKTGKEIGHIPSSMHADYYYYYNRLRYWDSDNGLYGLFDENLNVAVRSEYAHLGVPGRNGLVLASKDGTKFGYIDRDGEEVIPEQYDYGYTFYGTATVVGVDTLYGIIDETGKYLVEPQEKILFPRREDVFLFVDGKKVGLWDKNGKELAPAVYYDLRDFHDGLARFYKDDMFGFVNTKGVEVIPATFYFCYDFYGGYCWVQRVKDGDWELIDKTGKVVYTLTTGEGIVESWLRNELTLVGKWEDYSNLLYRFRYIDTQGNELATWTEYFPDSTSAPAPRRMDVEQEMIY